MKELLEYIYNNAMLISCVMGMTAAYLLPLIPSYLKCKLKLKKNIVKNIAWLLIILTILIMAFIISIISNNSPAVIAGFIISFITIYKANKEDFNAIDERDEKSAKESFGKIRIEMYIALILSIFCFTMYIWFCFG